MIPRLPGAVALSPADLAPLLGRLVKVRTLTRDGRAEADTLTGWLVSVRSDRLELTLHVGARRWVRLPRVLALEPYTLGDLRHMVRGAADLLRQSLEEHRNSKAPNDNQACGSPQVNKDASRGEMAGKGTSDMSKATEAGKVARLRQAWKDYNGDLGSIKHANVTAARIDEFGAKFNAACDAGDFDAACDVFQHYQRVMEGRE